METAQTRTQAKLFIHKNLLDLIDLRRTSYEELKGTQIRSRVENVVRQCLQKFSNDISTDAELVREIVDEAIGLGPLEKLLRDSAITEIMVNGPNSIYIEKNGRIETIQTTFVNTTSLRSVIDRIVSPLGRRIDESSPMVDARLPDGSRVNVIIPPLALNGPTLTIRKFSKIPLSVKRLIELGSLSHATVQFLRECVILKKNILIAGGTGSGKTTLLNALSAFIPSNERIVTIEDAAELKLPQEHVISLEARPANVEGKGEVTIRDLVRNSLRMRPDRIVIGECRGGETLDMLQAMNTGHDGSMTTVHANSPREALLRIETMVMMAGFELPLRAIREQLSGALDLIVYQARMKDGKRCVTQITEITGHEEDVISTQDLFVRSRHDAGLVSVGRLPKFADRLADFERERLIQITCNQEVIHDSD